MVEGDSRIRGARAQSKGRTISDFQHVPLQRARRNGCGLENFKSPQHGLLGG